MCMMVCSWAPLIEPAKGSVCDDIVATYHLLELLITESHVWLLKHSLQCLDYVASFYCPACD